MLFPEKVFLRRMLTGLACWPKAGWSVAAGFTEGALFAERG